MSGELFKQSLMKSTELKKTSVKTGLRNSKTVGKKERVSLSEIDPKRRRQKREKKRKMKTKTPNLLHSTTRTMERIIKH